MPRRGDPSAPRFTSPFELEEFWDDLELCFDEAGISDFSARSGYTFRYLDLQTRELWRSVSQRSPLSSQNLWESFKSSIFTLYPDSDPRSRFSLRSIETAQTKLRSKASITLDDLGLYYREFLTISNNLIDQNRYSISEANRSFITGFPSDFQHVLLDRLSLTAPEVFPDDGYDLELVVKVAKQLLHSQTYSQVLRSAPSSRSASSFGPLSSPFVSTPIPPSTTLQEADISRLFHKLASHIDSSYNNKSSSADQSTPTFDQPDQFNSAVRSAPVQLIQGF